MIEVVGLALRTPRIVVMEIAHQITAIKKEAELSFVPVHISPMKPSGSGDEYFTPLTCIVRGTTLHVEAINPEGCVVYINKGHKHSCVIHSVPFTVMQVLSALAQEVGVEAAQDLKSVRGVLSARDREKMIEGLVVMSGVVPPGPIIKES